MFTPEIAETLKNVNLYELAAKTQYKPSLLEDSEKVAIAELDKHFKKIGETGADPNHEVAAFITRVVTEEIYNAPDELLDMLFTRGTLGEFDDYDVTTAPKNTLVAYEAAKGGNVCKSFLDISMLKPVTKHLQVETDISYADLRKNGWKTVALLTTYAVESLRNKQFKCIFDTIDAAIASGAANYIAESTAKPTQATMDQAALYINDRSDNGVFVTLTKYVQAISKLTGFDSDTMRDEVHRTGRLAVYDGIDLHGISGAHKMADGTTQIADKRIYGIAGKIGQCDMKGAIRTYQTMDNNDEKIHIKVTGYEFTYSFNKDTLDNVCKVVLA